MAEHDNSDTHLPISTHLWFRLREGVLLLTLAIAAYLLLSLVTYSNADPSWSHLISAKEVHNAGGKVGAWLADFLLYLFGYFAYAFPILLVYGAWLCYRYWHRSDEEMPLTAALIIMKSIGFILTIVTATALASLYLRANWTQLPLNGGGILGTVVGSGMNHAFNHLGATLILSVMCLIGITLFTGVSWLLLMEGLGAVMIRGLLYLREWLQDLELRDRIRLPSISLAGLKSRITNLLPERAIKDDVTEAHLSLNSTMTDALMEPTFSEPAVAGGNPPVATPPATAVTKPKSSRRARRYSRGTIIPKLSLLDEKQTDKKYQMSKAEIAQLSELVESRLADFGVEVSVVGVQPGPVVTRYELDLAAGTKVSKITGLAKDLARSLSVVSVRVVEVIPGKSYVGIELPNEHREMVALKEVLDSKQYRAMDSALTMGLGKDIAGNPVVVDLAKMPHLLVAGTTGSGKSVGLNAMLLSLLYKSTPEQLRLIMIDPKMLELSVYDGIPHLLTPVVTDMKDASSALRWCVVEMERRYRLMAALGVRNIAGYNTKVKEGREKGQPLFDPLFAATDSDIEPPLLDTLPQVVVLADEFADMMVVVGKKVETLIARLAQKARAAGIHLILATQRPSVDVITGLIKANIPTRIAFQVSQKIDSRTILDQQGAEQLLGHGDMLYLPPGTAVPIRVHGAYVSDDEVHRVVESIKQSGDPDYIDEILDDTAGVDASGYTSAAIDDGDAEKDEFYDEAVAMVVQSRRVSISSIQRRFKIGYNRAARIVEAMEAAGVVSSMESNGQREVLAPKRSDS